MRIALSGWFAEARLAGEGKQVVVPTGIAVDAREAVVRVTTRDEMLDRALFHRTLKATRCAQRHSGLARGLRGRYTPPLDDAAPSCAQVARRCSGLRSGPILDETREPQVRGTATRQVNQRANPGQRQEPKGR